MKLKELMPKILNRAKSKREEAEIIRARLKNKAKDNDPTVDMDSRNPPSSIGLPADSSQMY